MSSRQVLQGLVHSGEEHLKWCLENLRAGHPATDSAKRLLLEYRDRLKKEIDHD